MVCFDVCHIHVQGRSQELEMGGAKLGEGSGAVHSTYANFLKIR